MKLLIPVHNMRRSILRLGTTCVMLLLAGCVGGLSLVERPDHDFSTFDVSGIVKNMDSGLPVAGAVVEINNRTATTKDDGSYSIKGIRAVSGRAFYQVSADDYLPRIGNIAASSGEHVILNVDLNAVVATGSAKITGRINFAAPDFEFVKIPYGDGDEQCTYAPSPRPTPTLAVTPNDPCFGYQYYLNQVHVPMAWSVTTGSRDIVVAVIDSGVDPNHPELAPNLIKGRNFVPDRDPDDMVDLLGHGTHVAGIIGAVGNNRTGIAGIAWDVSIMPLRTFYYGVQEDESVIPSAIRYAVDQGADIINLSLVGGRDYEDLREAVRYAIDQGVIVVAAVGNYGPRMDSTKPPSFYDGVIGVGSLSEALKTTIADISARGEGVYIVAPGESVFSTEPAGGYVDSSGTSMAAPIVSGIVALMLSNGIDPGDVSDILRRTAVEIGDPENNMKDLYTYGFGMVNAYGAVTATDPMDTKLFVLAPNGDVISTITSPDEFRRFELENVPAGNNLTLVGWIDVNQTGLIDRGDYFGSARFSVTDGDEQSLVLNLDVFDSWESLDLLSGG